MKRLIIFVSIILAFPFSGASSTSLMSITGQGSAETTVQANGDYVSETFDDLDATAAMINVLTFIWDDVDSRWLGFLSGKETP